MQPKISVIVPIYNLEKYLPECLDSLVNQTLPDIEILCINDGSTDNSLKILNQYASIDKRIKIINQKNSGVSVARNKGLECACGKYIAFCDGDDFLELNCLEEAYKEIEAKHSDVLVFGVCEIDTNNEKHLRWDNLLLHDFAQNKFTPSDFHQFKHILHSLWDKLYRTEFIKKNNLRFPQGIKIAEDGIFVLSTYFAGAKYSFVPKTLYNYRCSRPNSATFNNINWIKNQIEAFKYLEKLNWYKKLNNEIRNEVIDQFLDGCIWYINISKRRYRKHFVSELKWFMKYLIKTYGADNINQIENIQRIKHTFLRNDTFLRNLFSMCNTYDKKFKVITILFFKIYLKKKQKTVPVNMFKNANEKSVLIFESQPHHGECLPAYIKYFNDLGYHVDVLMLSELNRTVPFCRMPEDSDFSVLEYEYGNRAAILEDKNILKYKHILISTAICYYVPQSSVIQEFPIFRKHPSVFIVEHDLNDIAPNGEENYLKNKKIITLWNFGKGVMVNPNYFGNVNITPKNVTIFTVVGNLEKQRKNHQLLIESLISVLEKTDNLKILVIGKKIDKDINVPKKVVPYIEFTGYLDFPEMYNCLEKADFFIPLLDPETKAHNRYLTTGVTGSVQLIYGFAKVPLIHKKFASFYHFNSDNSIIYGDSLAEAILKGINMSQREYFKKQNKLLLERNKIYEKSKQNLKDILK